MTTFFKTAIATAAAVTAMTGAALAQDLTATGNNDLLQNIYAKIDTDRAYVFATVMATAEAKMEVRFAKIENNLFDNFEDEANPASVILIASND